MDKKTSTRKRRKFDVGFKTEALKMLNSGRSVSEVTRTLGIGELFKAYAFEQSMTRKDNHYDNAMGESFFSRCKAEMLEGGKFASFEDAYTEIFEYIEVYYNKKHRHSSLNNDFPERFEKRYWENQKNVEL